MTGDQEKSGGEGVRAQPHWTLDCRDHPPGGGARREGGSSCIGGQPTGYWKTAVLMGSALERRKTESEWGTSQSHLALPPAVGTVTSCMALLEADAQSQRPLLRTESKMGLQAETE